MADHLQALPKNPLRANQLDKVLRGQARVESTVDELRRSIDRMHETLKQGTMERKATTTFPVGSVSPLARGTSGNGHSARILGAMSGRLDLPASDSPHHIVYNSEDIYEMQVEDTSSNAVDLDHLLGDPVDARSTMDRVTTIGTSGEDCDAMRPIVAPHKLFQDLSSVIFHTEYAQVYELVRQRNMPRTMSSRSEPPFAREGRMAGLPLHPTSSGRIAWDLAGILVLMQDSLSVPIHLAWETETEGFYLVLSIFLAAFWTLDMIINFCTGYSESGKIVKSWKAIAVRYMKGGFLIDLGVLSVDYTELFVKLADPGMSSMSLRALRVLRFAKITRLVRVIAKLRLGLQTKIDAIWYYRIHKHGLSGYAQYLRLAAVLVKLLIFIAWLSHVGSCLWYFLGRTLSEDSYETWYQSFRDRGHSFYYVMGLYWSLSAMFSGASSQLPNTTWEAILSAVCVILGALFVTAVTSTLAAILIEAQEVQQDMKRKDRLLTSFLEQKSTPVLLALAVRADFLAQATSTARLTEQDLTFLPVISPHLQAALREHQYARHFMQLNTFRILTALQDSAMQDFCFTAASTAMFTSGQEVYATAHEIDSAILLSVGKLQYTLLYGQDQEARERVVSRRLSQGVQMLERSNALRVLESGTWVCELSLFLRWKTTGTLWTQSTCELLLVSTEAFIKVVTSSPEMAAFASMYGARVADAIQKDASLNPTDIDPGIDSDAIVADMHVSLRQLVSLPLLQMEFNRQQHLSIIVGKSRKKGLYELEAEVLAGQCHLVQGPSDEVCRVVRVVALRLMNSKGLLCVKIGTVTNGRATAKFQLPGRKLEKDELCEEAVRGILHEEFQELAPYTRFDHVETVMEDEPSASYGIQTKYIKTIQTAVLEADILFNFAEEVHGEASLPLHSVVAAASGYESMRRTGFTHTTTHHSTLGHYGPYNGASPLSTEGSEYAFAHSADPGLHSSQGSRCRSIFHLFKWVDPEDFHRLSTGRSRADVERAMTPWLLEAGAEKFESLTRWSASATVKSYAREPSVPRVDEMEAVLVGEDLEEVPSPVSENTVEF